ncbi:hypothetical protein [Amycolatopsis marina]|uniref:hypothetical protein n=1 Tax=Amycolatopsis marina TaxID=490629 RepID=UPI000B82384F|nr:hypothetical protein [Amycolatopsis marina]
MASGSADAAGHYRILGSCVGSAYLGGPPCSAPCSDSHARASKGPDADRVPRHQTVVGFASF